MADGKTIILRPNEVVITKERLACLEDTERLFDVLYGAGVDNWEGWDEAMAIYEERKEVNNG